MVSTSVPRLAKSAARIEGAIRNSSDDSLAFHAERDVGEVASLPRKGVGILGTKATTAEVIRERAMTFILKFVFSRDEKGIIAI